MLGASPSENSASCCGGSAGELRLMPGAWRNGMRGLSTTVSTASGLERSASTRASGTSSAWLSSLYGDGESAVSDCGSANGRNAAANQMNAARRREPIEMQATPAATSAVEEISCSAPSGGTTNSTSTSFSG